VLRIHEGSHGGRYDLGAGQVKREALGDLREGEVAGSKIARGGAAAWCACYPRASMRP
jgi:hypothetical protein